MAGHGEAAAARRPPTSEHRHGAQALGLQLAGQLMRQLRRNEPGLLHRQAASEKPARRDCATNQRAPFVITTTASGSHSLRVPLQI